MIKAYLPDTIFLPTEKGEFFRILPPLQTIFLTCAILILLCISVSAQTTLIDENFSTGSGATPPTGWTNNTIAGTGTDSWRYNNPGGKTINGPAAGQFAIFDSDNYSNNGSAENVALESPAFDASSYTSSLTLNFDHFFQDGFGGAYTVEVYNGTAWVSVLSGSATTANAASESIDILATAAGATNAKVRFRWTGNYSWYWAVDNVVVEGVSPVDSDGDGIADSEDLDNDNDGIPDAIECPGSGIELIVNGDFEDGYANWTSNFNRGRNNNNATKGGCVLQGWVAVSGCASVNGLCDAYYEYNGGTFDGSVLITDSYGTGANVIPTETCNQTDNGTNIRCLPEALPDHTSGTGFSLYIDPNDIVGESYWKQTVTVEANKTYEFSAWIMVIENTANLEFKI